MEKMLSLYLLFIFNHKQLYFMKLLFIVLRFAQEVLLVNLILIVVISIAKILIF